MARTVGAKNITPFDKRTTVESSANEDIKHLAGSGGKPLAQFENLLDNQTSFLNWIETRHTELAALKQELATAAPAKKGPKGPRVATFEKYEWYAEQLVMLESINALEVFYKRTIIKLADILQHFIAADAISGNIDAKVLWAQQGSSSVAALMFEPQLFHDLDRVDKATVMLVGKARYSDKAMKNTVRILRAIFQIRHTLSHNVGLITEGDATKFHILGFHAAVGEVIDPTKDNFRWVVLDAMRKEAKAFTDWLATAAAAFLKEGIAKKDMKVPVSKRGELESLLGTNPSWNTVPWS
jgi:hypothetical protein